MRRCIGLTKRFRRCRRSVEKSRVPLCHQHRRQPLLLLLFGILPLIADLLTVGGFLAPWKLSRDDQYKNGDPRAASFEAGVTLATSEQTSPTADSTDSAEPTSRPKVTYEIVDGTGPLVVRAQHPYLDQIQSGLVEGTPLDWSFYSNWNYPILGLRFLNTGTIPLSVGEIELLIHKIKPNLEPVVVVGSDSGRTLGFLNEGWGPVRKGRLSYSVLFDSPLPEGAREDVLRRMGDQDFAAHEVLSDFGQTTSVSIERALPKFIAPSANLQATIYGKLRYETVQGDARSLLFHTRTRLGSRTAGDLLPLTSTYDVFVDIADQRRSYIVPLSHVVQPGQADNIGLQVAASRSAQLEGLLIARSFDGTVLLSREFMLDILVPRSLAGRCISLPPFEQCKATDADAQARFRRSPEVAAQRKIVEDPRPASGQTIVAFPREAVENTGWVSGRLDYSKNVRMELDPLALPVNFIRYSWDRRHDALDLQRRLRPYEFELRHLTHRRDHLFVNFAEAVPRVLILHSSDHADFARRLAYELREHCLVTLSQPDFLPDGFNGSTLYLRGGPSRLVDWRLSDFAKEYFLAFAFRDRGDPMFMGQFEVLLMLATGDDAP